MIIDCIGCLHGSEPELQGGDLLIVTGDLTASDKPYQFETFILWLDKQKYKKKIFIAGNHDNILKDKPPTPNMLPDNVSYLSDSGIEYEGLHLWGSPWSLTFKGINPKCMAFTGAEEEIADHFAKIPKDTNILITHTPAYSILDENNHGHHCGSKYLYSWLRYVERPQIHVFSHIHEAYGQKEYFPTYDDKMMLSVNCSIMNDKYQPVNKPVRIVL